MAKRKKKKALWTKVHGIKRTWYVPEWLDHTGKRQKDIINATDWPKGEVSDWVNEKERFNTDVLYAFAHVLGVEPGRLLRPPPTDPVEDEFSKFVVQLDQKQKQRLLRLWRAVEGEDKAKVA